MPSPSPTSLKRKNYLETYRATLQHLRAHHGEERAMDLIVGGQSATIGILEHSLLSTLGLKPSDTVVDIGCGSGRLSTRLAINAHQGQFIGTDILYDLVEYAERKAARKEWRFHAAEGPPLPIESSIADFACFFSVFTHLHDEDIFRYLDEAKRILRPGGYMVFSFLDFAVPSHWTVFELSLNDTNPDAVLNKFISRDAIAAWAQHLQLNIARIYDGSEKWITLLEDIEYIDGRKCSGLTDFGQSIAVLQKPA